MFISLNLHWELHIVSAVGALNLVFRYNASVIHLALQKKCKLVMQCMYVYLAE